VRAELLHTADGDHDPVGSGPRTPEPVGVVAGERLREVVALPVDREGTRLAVVGREDGRLTAIGSREPVVDGAHLAGQLGRRWWLGARYAAFGFPWGRVAIVIGFFATAAFMQIIGFLSRRCSQAPDPNSRSGAKAILEERYAKGEITKKDFDSMKKDLS